MNKNLIAAVLIGAGIGLAPPNAKAVINVTLGEFTGADSVMGLTITDQPGGLLFELALQTPSSGSITGFWAKDMVLNDAVGLADWEASAQTGTIEVQQFSVDNIDNLGNGTNLEGNNSPAPMDLGLRFANGGGGLSSISFLLTGTGVNEAAFSGATFAARVQSLPGPEGSAKLVGSVTPGGEEPPPEPTPVPEPASTVTLLGLSLFGMEGLRRKLLKS